MRRTTEQRLADWGFWILIVVSLAIGSQNRFRGLVGPHMSIAALLLLALLTSVAAAGAISIYAHRHIAHGAVVHIHPALALTLRAWIWMWTGTNCRRWAAVHIKHHRASDSVGDPHSPVIESSVIRLNPWTNWGRYRAAMSNESIQENCRPAHGAQPDKWDRAVFDRTDRGPWMGGAALTVLLGPFVGLFVWFTHTVLFLTYTAMVNSLGHGYGYQRFTNHGARYTGNSFLLSLFDGGESFHNNHHGDPQSPFLGRTRWELVADWPALLLMVWAKLGLVALRTPSSSVPSIRHPQFAVSAAAMTHLMSSEHITTSSARRRVLAIDDAARPSFAAAKRDARNRSTAPRRRRPDKPTAQRSANQEGANP